jgi:hypothetical protein
MSCPLLTHCGPHGRYVTFPLKMWWTGVRHLTFKTRQAWTALEPNSLRPAAGYAILVVCLWVTVCDLAFITSYAKWLGLCSSSRGCVCACVRAASLISARFVTFRKESVITKWKNILGKIWFFQNYCQTIYPMFLRTFFSENDDEKQKLCREKKYSESKRSSEESNSASSTGQPHG